MCLTRSQSKPFDQVNDKISQLPDIGSVINQDSYDYIELKDVQSLNVKDNDLMCLQLSIRGLISKQSNISHLVNSCSKSQKKLDVVLLCETWVTENTKELVLIPGYDFIGIECQNKKGGGIGLLIANEIKYKIRNDISYKTEELECVTVQLLIKGRNILCCSMYRPPNTNVKTFQSVMNKCMEQIKSEMHCDSIIGMDHNLDFIKYNCHRDTEKFMNMMLENSSFLCITRPTRVNKSTVTLIDNIFVCSKLQNKLHSGIILHDISDHFLSIVIVEGILARKQEQKVMYTRDITDCKINAIQYDLTNVNWSEFEMMLMNATKNSTRY